MHSVPSHQAIEESSTPRGCNQPTGAEPHAAVGQAGDGVDQLSEGAAEPVEVPDDQGVARAQLVEELLEDRAVGAGAAGGLGEHPVAAGTLEGVHLELGCWSMVETRA
jgi:hypothetical protein